MYEYERGPWAAPLPLWKIGANTNEGGSTWFVRAPSQDEALKALQAFWNEHYHDWRTKSEWRFYVQAIDDSPGKVFKGV